MSSLEDGVFLLSPATDGGVYQLVNSGNNVNTATQPAPTQTQIIRQTTPDGTVKLVKRVIKIVNVKPNQTSQPGLVGATVRPGGPNITVPQVRVVPQNQNYTVVSSVQQPVITQGVPTGTLATVKEPGKNIVRILVKPKPKSTVPQQAIAPGQSLLRTGGTVVRAAGTPIVVSQPTASIVIPKQNPQAPLVYARPPTPIVVSRPQVQRQYIVTNNNGTSVVKPVSSVLNPQNKAEELELVDSLVDDNSPEEDFEIAPPQQEIRFPKYRVVRVNNPVANKQTTLTVAAKPKVEEVPVPETEVQDIPKEPLVVEQVAKVEEKSESFLEKDTELAESSIEDLRKELDDSGEDLVDNTEIPDQDIEKAESEKAGPTIKDITFQVSVQKDSDISKKKDKVSEQSSSKTQKDSIKKEKSKKSTPEKDFRKPAVS